MLRVFDAEWDCPAGHCELVGGSESPLAEVVVVGGLAVPRVPRTDSRGPGTGDWAVVGGSSPHDDAAAGRTLAGPRASPGLTDWGRSDADAWALLCTVTSPFADGTEVDKALVLAAAERAAGADCWRVAGLLLLGGLVVLLAVLRPPTLRASSPSTLFEPEADHPLLGRLTLGGSLSPWSHKEPSSARPSASSAPSCGGGAE